MMTELDDAIITVSDRKHPKSIGRRCAMVGHPMDVDEVCALAELSQKNSHGLLLSRLYFNQEAQSYSLIGPLIGAPYAVMLLETAVSWGIKELVFFGWCGAVSFEVQIGDIIVPDLALIDEGTSKDYLSGNFTESKPSLVLQNRLKKILAEKNIQFHEGAVWSTDAIFRETPKKVAAYREKGALGVDMETSALFSAGQFRNIQVCCVLVVSDEVSGPQWKKGFATPKFKESRQQVSSIVGEFLMNNTSKTP
jgi:purine-nucleoside phosphorylase